MATYPAMGPVSAGSATIADYRQRSGASERSLMVGGSKKSHAASDDSDELPFFEVPDDQAEPPAEPEIDRTSDFAAAVIACALPPAPQSMEELVRRISANELSEQSQARLKDLLA